MEYTGAPPSHSKTKYDRKILLINPRFQLGFMAFVIGLSVLAIAIFYAANLFFFWKFRALGLSIGLPPDHVFFQFISEQQYRMNLVFGLTSLAVIVVLGFGGLLYSHWIAGPLYRLHKHMLEVAAGKTLADVKFRKRDFFPELADAYNAHLGVQRRSAEAQQKQTT